MYITHGASGYVLQRRPRRRRFALGTNDAIDITPTLGAQIGVVSFKIAILGDTPKIQQRFGSRLGPAHHPEGTRRVRTDL